MRPRRLGDVRGNAYHEPWTQADGMVYINLPKGECGQDRFEAWLHRLLVRACHREARRDRRRRSIEIRELPLDDRAGLDELPILFDRDQLERGFPRLGVEERAVSSSTTSRASRSRRSPTSLASLSHREVPSPPGHPNDAGGARRRCPRRVNRSGADGMTARADFDRQLTLAGRRRPTMAPEGLLDEVIDRVAATPRGRAGRWQIAGSGRERRPGRRPIRASLVAAVVVLLLLAIIAAVILVGSPVRRRRSG